VDEVRSRLEQRLIAELAAYQITCSLTIRCAPIRLPADNRKMKRFERV
jgi:hypothetical protein